VTVGFYFRFEVEGRPIVRGSVKGVDHGIDPPPAAVAGRSMDSQFSLLQARLSHEDDLINQRVSWLVNSQSFLLTAYAITLNGLAADASKPLAIVQRKLLNLLPLVGVACVLLVCVALIGGLCALGCGVLRGLSSRKIDCFSFPSRQLNFLESAPRS
jgi:hypothetical protein